MVLSDYLGNCPASTLASLDSLSTSQKTTLLPLGKDGLLGAVGTIYV